YPPALDGKPVGIQTYLPIQPTAPVPPDGACNDYYNAYWYTQIDPNHYTLTFCVGGPVAGLPGGVLVLSEAGLQPYTCPENDADCQRIQTTSPKEAAPEQTEEEKIAGYYQAVLDLIKTIPYSATYTVEIENKN